MTNALQNASPQSAAVIEQSLLAFGVGMDLAVRTDIKHAFQFASLAASKAHPGDDQTEQWFDLFVRVMRDMGWVALKRSYERESSQAQSLKLGAVAFKTMKVVGQAVLSNPLTDALAQLATEALEGLGKITEAQDLLKRNLREKQVNTVGLAACMQNEAGEIILAMSAIDSKPFDDHQLHTMVFEWESQATAHYSAGVVFVFNRDMYGAVRDSIRERLEDRTVRNVLDYAI